MTTTELKKYINQNDKIPFILEKCGCTKIKLNSKGEYSNYSACAPSGDNPMGCVIDCNDYLNYCSYSRGVSFDEQKDLIDFVQSAKNMSFLDAVKWLHQLLEIPISFSKKPAPQPVNKQDEIINMFKQYKTSRKVCDVNDIKFLDPKELRDFEPKLYIGWLREGVMPWAAKKFGIMYSYRNSRIIMPIHYWLDGRVIGYNARTTVKDYDLLGISKFYITKDIRKDINLYGLWQNREAIEKARTLFLCEPEKGVLKMSSVGDDRWCALEGKTISSEQRRIILGLDIDEIVICLDKDVDIEKVWTLCEKFYGLKKVSYIHDKWNLLGEKDSITDKCFKVRDYLIKHRTVYDERMHKKYLKWLENN